MQEEEREVQTVSAAPVAAVPAGAEVRRAQPAYPDRDNTFVEPRMDHKIGKIKVVSMQIAGKKQFKLVVTEPKSFDECPKFVDNLK